MFINNAATFAPDGDGQLMLPDMDEFMRVNAVAPVYMAEALVDQVASSERKLMVFIGTRSGSIGDNIPVDITLIAAAKRRSIWQ